MTIDLRPQSIATLEFIQTIKGNKGPYCVRTLPDIPAQEHGSQNYSKNRTFKTEAELLRAIRGGLPWANSFRNGVFLVVNNGGHSDNSINEVTAQFIDFDHVPMEKQLELLDAFGLDPSIITLPRRGLHSFWRVKGGDVTKFRAIQERLIHFFGSDPTVKNESRLMRLPGFYHQKAAPKMVNVMYWHPENVYTQDELIRRLDELGVPQIAEAQKRKTSRNRAEKEQIAPIGIVDQRLLLLVGNHLGEMTTSDGEQYQCLCPMHDDHKPSGVYFAGNQWFYCHGCQANLSLSELAQLNRWTDILEYRDEHRKSARMKSQAVYEGKLQQALAAPYSMSEYVHTQTKVESLRVQQLVHDVTNTFVTEMEQRGLRVSEAQRQSVRHVIRLWEQSENANEPIVWPALPGSGKSTLRNLYVNIKCNADPAFGCILVVQRKEDAEVIAAFLNRYVPVAWCYLGWDVSWCLAGKSEYERGMCRGCGITSCRVLRNQEEQLRRPVVITTHQRFLELARAGKLGSTLGHWVDEQGERHDRRLLIIDEALPMIKRATITRGDLERLNAFLHKRLTESPSLHDEWSSLYHDTTRFLADVTNTRYVTAQDIAMEVPGRLKRALDDLPSETWDTLLHFLKHGGIVHEDRDDGFTVTVSEPITYKWDGLCPFILDGTGTKDLRYPAEYRALPEIIDARPPMSLHVCTDFGFGKWYMARNKDRKVLECHAAVAKSLALKHQKVLIVVRKDYEPEYLQLLANEIEQGEVVIAHFGNLKGRNDYDDCDAVLFLGLLDKGDEHYMAEAIAQDTDTTGIRLDTQEYNNVHRFTSVELERLKLNEVALDFVQDVFRTQVRRGKPVDVYAFSRDKLLMVYVAQLLRLPEINVAWKPLEVVALTKAEKHVSKLIAALIQFLASGEPSITKSELKTKLGVENMSDRVWRRLMKNEYVQAFCLEHGIVERAPNSRVLEISHSANEVITSQLA